MVKRYKFNDLKEDKDGMFVKFEDYDKVVGVVNQVRDSVLDLLNYAVHLPHCDKDSWAVGKCDCGLNATLKKIDDFEQNEQHKYA